MPPAHVSSPRIAVIGAGITGITCAHFLHAHGLRCTVFEKSRGLGGRLATRRTSRDAKADDPVFDHGGQFFTARSEAFLSWLQAARDENAVETWDPEGKSTRKNSEDPWLVGAPAMNALLKPLAADLDICLETEVTAARRAGGLWEIRSSNSDLPQFFDVLICTTPAPQADRLLAAEPGIVPGLTKVVIAPCWALMLAFDQRFDPGFEVKRTLSDDIDWIARDSSKPGRTASADCWILHFSPLWSANHLEIDKQAAAAKMVSRFKAAMPDQLIPDTTHIAAHRWRYAKTITPLGAPFLSSRDQTLYIGGDWCLGARVEYGFDSGRAIATSLIKRLADPVMS